MSGPLSCDDIGHTRPMTNAARLDRPVCQAGARHHARCFFCSPTSPLPQTRAAAGAMATANPVKGKHTKVVVSWGRDIRREPLVWDTSARLPGPARPHV